jgi:hypothetical protein
MHGSFVAIVKYICEFIDDVGKIVGHIVSGGNGPLELRNPAAIAKVFPGSIMGLSSLSPYPKACGFIYMDRGDQNKKLAE